jgi:CRP/FNR family cyclic AMP-dependent transcriptional regulator
MDLLSLTAHLPEITLEPGDTLVAEGGTGGALWVLLEGELEVSKGAVQVSTISAPGSLVGEISVLLDVPYTATVRALVASKLRVAADGRALLDMDPQVARLVAMGLASRLNVVTHYFADLKRQYGDAPGLSMVGDVLAQLAQRQAMPVRSGSLRDSMPGEID